MPNLQDGWNSSLLRGEENNVKKNRRAKGADGRLSSLADFFLAFFPHYTAEPVHRLVEGGLFHLSCDLL